MSAAVELDPAVAVGRASRRDQGLPERVEDPTVLAQAARLIVRTTTPEEPTR